MPSLWDPFGRFDPQPSDPLDPYIGAYGPRSLTGPGRGSPIGNPVQAREASPLTLTRERMQRELEDNPFLQRGFDANTTAEVGTDPEKRRWYQALTMDRAAQTGEPLANIVNNPNYYPSRTTGATATTGQGVDPSLWQGANPANYATGNASYDPRTGRWVGFAGGPQTSTYGTGMGMELGGIEGQGGLPYARAVGYTGPSRTAIGPGGPQGVGDTIAMAGGAPTGPYASGPSPARKSMPASLMDMFTPTSNVTGQPIGFGDAIAQNRNSLIGLGMGLLQPRSLAVGAPATSAWTNALSGYQQGAQTDAANAYRQQQLLHQTRQEAFQRSQAAQAQANFERTFARGDVTDFQKAAKDLGLTPGTPEYAAAAKTYYEPKVEGDWSVVQAPHPTYPGETVPVWANKRTQEIRPFGNPPPGAGNAFAGGGGGGVSYGQAGVGPGGFGTGGTGPAYPRGPAAASVTSADAIPPAPPGSDPKEWRKEQTKLMVQKRIADELRTKQQGSIDPVTEDIDRAINQTRQYPGMIAGGFGNLMKNVPGSQARDVANLVDTIKANASLDKLQAMRAASPTGASGLGAVTQGEHKILQDSIGALDQSQTPDQFLFNLDRVKRIRHEIIHGPGTAPPPQFELPEAQRAPAAAAGGAPRPGMVRKGYVFTGGDPSKEENWAPVRK